MRSVWTCANGGILPARVLFRMICSPALQSFIAPPSSPFRGARAAPSTASATAPPLPSGFGVPVVSYAPLAIINSKKRLFTTALEEWHMTWGDAPRGHLEAEPDLIERLAENGGLVALNILFRVSLLLLR